MWLKSVIWVRFRIYINVFNVVEVPTLINCSIVHFEISSCLFYGKKPMEILQSCVKVRRRSNGRPSNGEVKRALKC